MRLPAIWMLPVAAPGFLPACHCATCRCGDVSAERAHAAEAAAPAVGEITIDVVLLDAWHRLQQELAFRDQVLRDGVPGGITIRPPITIDPTFALPGDPLIIEIRGLLDPPPATPPAPSDQPMP